MKKNVLFGLIISMMAVTACNEDNDTIINEEEKYEGVTFSKVLTSDCQGDIYGMAVNIINLQLSEGEIQSDGRMGFEGEGSCLVLSLMSKITEDMLPVKGEYVVADYDKMELEQRFEAGMCEYNPEFNEWLAMGSYLVEIDKDNKKNYTAFTDGTVTISTTEKGYLIDVILTSADNIEYKARYEGTIDFTVPTVPEKYQYESTETSQVNFTPGSVDIIFFGHDSQTGLSYYKLSFWGDNQQILQSMLYVPDTHTGMITDGSYNISETPTANSCLGGYIENDNLQGTVFAQYNESYEHLLYVWYLTAGQLDIKSSGDQIEINLTSTSAYGSTITLIYKGTYMFRDLTEI